MARPMPTIVTEESTCFTSKSENFELAKVIAQNTIEDSANILHFKKSPIIPEKRVSSDMYS